MANDRSRFRGQMVKTQLISRGIEDPVVLKAMGQVPREVFVPPDLVEVAYDDWPCQLAEIKRFPNLIWWL